MGTILLLLTLHAADGGLATISVGKAELSSQKWIFLRSEKPHADVRVEVTATILTPATRSGYFGSSWSVWPSRAWDDEGFEVGVVLREARQDAAAVAVREDEQPTYRVQLSHKYQAVALVRYPDAGVVRVVACPVKLKTAHRLSVSAAGNTVAVSVDGVERIRYADDLTVMKAGHVGVGTSSGAKVAFEKLSVTPLPAREREKVPPHGQKFSAREWLGGRQWVFDGDEPILMLPTPDNAVVNSVKLRPGHRPQLSWNAMWDIANQGAYKEGESKLLPAKTSGGGKILRAEWVQKHNGGRFETRTTLTVGWDPKRKAYTYGVESELEVLPGKPFLFRYGYDFEHHTPLDPFRWQYLIARKKGGAPYRRPVYPIDPGPQNDLETDGGVRVWYGRHSDPTSVSPAVEYAIKDTGGRKMNTAVCAAFYDTGVSYPAETAAPGTKVRVAYRYTGYPEPEAGRLFTSSTVYESPMLDPAHHYLFADTWPRITFDRAVPMSETWIYGRRPFMTGHNRRPTYEWAKEEKAMRLGPGSFAEAVLAPIPDRRHIFMAEYKTDNIHGPGGRIEITLTHPKTGKVLKKHVHYPGKADDWWPVRFMFDVPEPGAGLTLGFGNAGTGEMLVRSIAFREMRERMDVSPGEANNKPARTTPAPKGAIADYHMEEGKGLHVYNHAAGAFGLLELANVGWTRDAGRTALQFKDDPERKPTFPRAGALDLNHLSHPAYKGRDRLPVALTGHHGGSLGDLKAFTITAWIKPAATMGKSAHSSGGDIVGFGARRFILRLAGARAPYQLQAAFNVNDRFTAKADVVADRWQHVALTGEPAGKKWRVRLYLDGKEILAATTDKMENPASPPPSLILGTEIFYFHDSYYRGLIGRTQVYNRALSADEVRKSREPGA